MSTTISSITRQGSYEPWNLQVSRNQIQGHEAVDIFGYSAAIGNTAQGPLWEGQTQSGGLYTPPSSAAQLVLTSSSATDDTTRSVLIEGLDAAYQSISEVIALNGTSNVTTTKEFLRINRMSMVSSTNTGTITAKISSTLYAQINAGVGQTQMSIYTVPAGYTLYLEYVQYDANIGFTSAVSMVGQEYNKDNTTGAITLVHQTAFVQKQEIPYNNPVPHPEKMDMQFCVKSSSGGPFTCSLFANGILIKNGP